MEKDILTPKHRYWSAFYFRLDQMINTHVHGKPVFRCYNDLRHSKKILKSLHNIDVEGSVEFLKNRGGYCDCEVITNVM